ncbi:hypothetical protein AX15_002659 [Amanita polypyramis BW_CC]|nr:hypothetical protein AX15_002659 [Amanita polypyramis BW_CC]
MMFLRIRSLYRERKLVYYIIGIFFIIQTGVYAWLLCNGEPVPHSYPKLKACTMVFNIGIGKVATSSSAWIPLLYDSFVFLLTLYCVWPKWELFNFSVLKKRLFEDGLIYYSAIFAVTLTLTFMIAYAPVGVKNIAAQLELLVAVTMMSRITLNLKKVGARRGGIHEIEVTPRPARYRAPEIHLLENVHTRKPSTSPKEHKEDKWSTYVPPREW